MNIKYIPSSINEICLGSQHRRFVGKLGRCLSLLSILLLPAGCTKLAAVWANVSGGDWTDAEFTLTKEPLLVLIDDRNSIVTEPKAIREVHKTISENFLAFKVNRMIVPFDDWQRLMQSDKNYARYSVRQIGEKLGAEQILYITVDRFTVHAEPGAPIYKGEFTVRVKVLGTNRQKDVRLWPTEESGKRVSVTTPPAPIDSDKTPSDIATELGIRLGRDIAMMFYGHREFQK